MSDNIQEDIQNLNRVVEALKWGRAHTLSASDSDTAEVGNILQETLGDLNQSQVWGELNEAERCLNEYGEHMSNAMELLRSTISRLQALS